MQLSEMGFRRKSGSFLFSLLYTWTILLHLTDCLKFETSLPKKGLEYANLHIDEDTGNVYVQTVNSILNYSPNLVLQDMLITGPQMTSERCPSGGKNCTCPLNDQSICSRYYTYTLQDSWPAGFAVDNKNDILVVCHSLHHGECRLIDLDNFSFLDQKAEFISVNTAGLRRESQPKIIIAEGFDQMVVYQANPVISEVIQKQYGADAPKPNGDIYIATVRQLPSLQPYTFEEPTQATSNIFNLKMYSGLGSAASLVPLHIFTWEGCTYFLSSDLNLVRICQALPTRNSVVTSLLNLGRNHDSSSEDHLVAHTGEAGKDILGDIEKPTKALFLHATWKSESYAATYVFSLDKIAEHFSSGITECLQGSTAINQYSVHDMEKNIPEISCSNWTQGHEFNPQFVEPCQKPWNVPLMSIAQLQPDISIEYSSDWAVLLATVVDSFTLVYANRNTNGETSLILAGLQDKYVYEEHQMDEVKLLKKFEDNLYAVTDKEIVRLRQDPERLQLGCYRFKTCQDLKNSRTNLHCGYCLESRRVSDERHCSRESSQRPVLLNFCPSVSSVSPRNVLLEDYKEIEVEIEVPQLEAVVDAVGSEPTISCTLMDGAGLYTAAKVERDGETIKCENFPTAAPRIPSNGYKDVNVSVSLNGISYGSGYIKLYSCNKFSNCSSCVRPSLPCSWCIQSHSCFSSKDMNDVEESCEDRSIISKIVEDIPRARSKDVGWGRCPSAEFLESPDQSPTLATGETVSLSFRLNNVERGFNMNKLTCRFNGTNAEILGLPARTFSGDYSMTCRTTEMNYPEDMPFKIAPVDIVDEYGQPLDNPKKMEIEVYKCSSIVTTCGGCITLDKKYECGWCASSKTCTKQSDCPSSADTWLGNDDTCADPVISRFAPISAPAGGGTMLTVHGSNLGTKMSDLQNGVKVGGVNCEVQNEGFEPSTSFVCKLGRSQVGQGHVEVTVNDLHTAKSDFKFNYVMPKLDSVDPRVGPAAGGTNITLHGENLHLGDNIRIRMNGTETQAEVIKRNASTVMITTPKASKSPKFRVYPEIIFDDATTVVCPVAFEYVLNPRIKSVTPHATLLSGGTEVEVVGNGLSSVQDPQIVIYVGNPTKIIGGCVANSSKVMNCKTPDLASSMGVTSLPGTVFFKYGFIMDGVDSVLDVTDRARLAKFEFYPNPSIDNNDAQLEYEEGEPLIIRGKNLDVFKAVPGVSVTVGNGPCVVTNLSSTTLICKPPSSPKDLSPEGHALVLVQLGNYMERAGAMTYPGSTDVTLVVAITLGVFLPIILAIIIVVVCLRREHNKRNTKKKKPQRPPSAIELDGGETEAFIRHDMNSLSNRSIASNRYVRQKSKKKNETALNGAAGGQEEESLYEELDDLQVMNNEKTDYLLSKIHDEELRKDVQSVLIPRENLVIGDAVGKGNFGRVYLAVLVRNREAEKRVAVKTLQGESLDDETFEAFLQEGLRMKNFKHPHVLQLFGIAMSTEQYPMVVLPYMANGDLRSYVKDKTKSFTARELVQLGQQVAQGMAYLASLSCVHRDLAARNCMIDDEFCVKVADFGLSKHLTENTYVSSEEGKKRKMPIKWMALESLEEMTFTVKTDVWSYGILLWELMTRGMTPYPDVEALDVRDYLVKGRRLRQPRFCPDNVYQVMYKCWLKNPDERPTFADLVNRVELIINPTPQLTGANNDEEPIYMNVRSSDSAEYLNPVISPSAVAAANESVA